MYEHCFLENSCPKPINYFQRTFCWIRQRKNSLLGNIPVHFPDKHQTKNISHVNYELLLLTVYFHFVFLMASLRTIYAVADNGSTHGTRNKFKPLTFFVLFVSIVTILLNDEKKQQFKQINDSFLFFVLYAEFRNNKQKYPCTYFTTSPKRKKKPFFNDLWLHWKVNYMEVFNETRHHTLCRR